MIPVSVITGFLGSGKTTLLSRLMRDPAMGRTAVIVNEFGEIGLDHDLVETSTESFVQLSNGCLCCNVRSDLTATLADLAVRRGQGTVPPFERVVIETSGLADPAPILHSLMADAELNGLYALGSVVTVVDALLGLATLDAHETSRRQAAMADRVVLTKTDMAGAQTHAVSQRINALNPRVQIHQAVRGAMMVVVAVAMVVGRNNWISDITLGFWLARRKSPRFSAVPPTTMSSSTSAKSRILFPPVVMLLMRIEIVPVE